MEREIRSSRLGQEEVEKIKASRDFLHEDDQSLFIKYIDDLGAERSLHVMKLAGDVGGMRLENYIDQEKSKLEAKGFQIIKP